MTAPPARQRPARWCASAWGAVHVDTITQKIFAQAVPVRPRLPPIAGCLSVCEAMFASRLALLGRAPLQRGTQVLRGGALSCSRPTVQPWKSLRQLTSQCTRPPLMAQRAPRPAMSGASLQPWRLAGGSARARMLCTPAQPAAAETGPTMLKRALDWAGENRTVVGVLIQQIMTILEEFSTSDCE